MDALIIDAESEPSRDRTYDPQIKSLLLYQLSYRPKFRENYTCGRGCVKGREVRERALVFFTGRGWRA